MKTKRTKLKQFLEKNGEFILYIVFLLLLGFSLWVLIRPLYSLEYLRVHFIFYQEMKVLVKYFLVLTLIFLFFSAIFGLLLNKVRVLLGILTKREKEFKELQERNKKLEEILDSKKINAYFCRRKND